MRFLSSWWVVLVAVVAAVILVVAVRGNPLDRSSGEPAEDFAMVGFDDHPLLDGDEVMFSEVVDNSDVPIVLNFWAADCPPCRVEMPVFQQVADELDGEVMFVGVDVGVFTGLGSREGGQHLLDILDIRYPSAYAADASAVQDYEIRSMPTTLFISQDGYVEERVDGPISERLLREILGNVL